MEKEYIEEIRLLDIVDSVNSNLKYLLKKWYIVILGVGGLTFLFYLFAKNSPPTYIANAKFSAIDARSNGAGSLMSFASSLGLNVGGSTNDILMGIFMSRNVFKKCLLDDVVTPEGKKEKLGNLYLDALGYTSDKDPNIKPYRFKSNNLETISFEDDSISSALYGDFYDGILQAEFDPISGLIISSLETPSRFVSKTMSKKLLDYTDEFYGTKQISTASNAFEIASKRVDSIATQIKIRELRYAKIKDVNIFNKKQESVYNITDLQREISILSSMYAEAVSSKEASKASLNNKDKITNLRIVDDPNYSVDTSTKGIFLWSIIGFAIGMVIFVGGLLFKKAINDARDEENLKMKEKVV